MAIYKRDRHFQSLMSEIEVATIPLRFVDTINCVLYDGTHVSLNQSNFTPESDGDIENIIKELEFFDSIADLRIDINFDKVEADVDNCVARLLKRKDDQSNSGM